MDPNDPYIAPVDSTQPPPRHSVPIPPLVAPDGEPIPPTSPVDPLVKRVAINPPPLLHERVTANEDSITNIGTGVLVAGTLAAVALILVLILGGFYLTQRSEVHDLQAHLTASDMERARVDGIQRDATCTVVRSLRATNTPGARSSFPNGTGPYDALMAQLNKAAVTDNCDAG